MENWEEACRDTLPALGAEAQAAVEAIPSGRAFHLSVVTLVCNEFHPHGSRSPTACATCRHASACASEVEAALKFAASLAPLIERRGRR